MFLYKKRNERKKWKSEDEKMFRRIV